MVFLLTPQVVSAGASTSLFGLFAAVVGLAYFTKHPFLQQIGRMFTVLIVANLVMNLFSLGNVSIWAHIGEQLEDFCCQLFFLQRLLYPPFQNNIEYLQLAPLSFCSFFLLAYHLLNRNLFCY